MESPETAASEDDSLSVLNALLLCPCSHRVAAHDERRCAVRSEPPCPCERPHRAALAYALSQLQPEQLLALHDLIEDFALGDATAGS